MFPYISQYYIDFHKENYDNTKSIECKMKVIKLLLNIFQNKL